MKLRILKFKTNRGSTIIELVIYSALFITLLLVVSSVFATSFSLQRESESASYVQQDSRYIFQRLEYDIHRADDISIPSSSGSSSEVLQLSEGINILRYSVVDGVLYIDVNGAVERLNSNVTQIRSIEFVRGEGETISVTIVIASLIEGEAEGDESVLQTTIRRR